jgi:hypothetical protein
MKNTSHIECRERGCCWGAAGVLYLVVEVVVMVCRMCWVTTHCGCDMLSLAMVGYLKASVIWGCYS